MRPSAPVLVAAALASAASAQPEPCGHTMFRDPERKIEVRYDIVGEEVRFSSRLPAGWSFTIHVDGDQNGVWGYGPSPDLPSADSSADRSFGKDQNGTFCAQYVLTSFPEDSNQIRVSSDCDALPSKGSIEIAQMDAQRRAVITLKVPMAEVFGDRPDAHIQVCVWDTRSSSCQSTLAKPFLLPRRAVAAQPSAQACERGEATRQTDPVILTPTVRPRS